MNKKIDLDKKAMARRIGAIQLYKTKEYEGYLMRDIKNVFTDEEFNDFAKWFNGQTGAIHSMGHHQTELLVYKYDMERYLEDLAVID